MIKKSINVAIVSMLMSGVVMDASALDKQGKTSLETNKSRPKENSPSKTGAQRVQDKTQSRTNEALSKSAAQQGKTQKSVKKTMGK